MLNTPWFSARKLGKRFFAQLLAPNNQLVEATAGQCKVKPVETLVAHADAAWELAYHIDTDHLLLCSANGTCKLWNPSLKTP